VISVATQFLTATAGTALKLASGPDGLQRCASGVNGLGVEGVQSATPHSHRQGQMDSTAQAHVASVLTAIALRIVPRPTLDESVAVTTLGRGHESS